MAVPKRKHSKERKRKRRSHLRIAAPGMAKCSQCHSWKRPHSLCSNCGHYAGREVFRIEEEL